MFNWLKFRNWGIVKVYRDFENYADWRRVIKKEAKNPKSKFNNWKLNHSKLYDVYTTISLDEVDAQLPEVVQRTKVIESLNPLHRYLDEELGFVDCLNVEFNQFQDEKGIPTLTYLIVYSFRFEKFSILWLIKFIFFNSAIAFLVLKFDLIPLLITWLSNLI